MNTFARAVELNSNIGYTQNGMTTQLSSLDPCVDLFFAIGSSRGRDLSAQFEKAFVANPSIAMRMLFWTRDIRGGAGERGIFRSLLTHLERTHPDTLVNVLHLVPEYGRWDDLLVFESSRLRLQAYAIITRALREGNGLASKWMPRKGNVARQLRDYMNETPKGYRKLLVSLTNVVEQKMCANEWSNIEYGHVPSLAAARYQNAFNKHDSARYAQYKESLNNGTAKINATAVYPYDVLKSLERGDMAVAEAQWAALPNYLGDDFILPLIDVSGSMGCQVTGNKSLQCMDVAISLGLYLADKQQGAFNGMYLTFSANSRIVKLNSSGNLADKVSQIRGSDWGYNTSLESAYKEILKVAKAGNVPNNQMPKYLLILSDMEFDTATGANNVRAIDMARDLYERAGYELPRIVFWNLNARDGNVPVSFKEDGTALVSGFSPAILKSILGAETFNPLDIMMETLNSERYAPVAEALQ